MKLTTIILYLLSSAWMLGISIKFLHYYTIYDHIIIYPNLFDFIFDWTILFLLGLLLLITTIYDYILSSRTARTKQHPPLQKPPASSAP